MQQERGSSCDSGLHLDLNGLSVQGEKKRGGKNKPQQQSQGPFGYMKKFKKKNQF